MAIPSERLTGQDVANLLVEAPDTPMHMGVLTVFEGEHGGLAPQRLLALVRERVESRLEGLPELRRALRDSAIPGRKPLWRDNGDVLVEHHVRQAAVPAPGDEGALAQAAADLMEQLLERSRPLWEMWVLTGLAGGRWATLLKIHHSLTDGYGMLQIALRLFESPGGVTAAHFAAPGPSPVRRAISTLTSPAMAVATVASVIHRTWHGGRADLLRPIGRERRLEVVTLDLAAVKRAAHAEQAKVNDVLLELAAAGIRAALVARGEPVDKVVLRGLMAVSPWAARSTATHNRAGSVIVSLPLGASSAADRLRSIAADSRRARRWQRSAVIERSMVLVARSRLGRTLSRHQRVVDLAVSNLVGPPAELALLGDRMVQAVPLTPISGNVTVDFCALSYAGTLTIGILADAEVWPDLGVVAAGMRESAAELGVAGSATTAKRPLPAAIGSR